MIKCSKCKFYNNYKDINCHSFFGNPNADILFVGECFHNDDKPFSTDIESIFIDLLNYANLKIEDVAITNAIHCYSDSTPTIKEIDACFINLYNDIKAINPKLIITMGDCAFSSVLGKPKKEYSNYIGKLEYSEKVKCNVYLIYQPSSAIYNRGRLQDLRSFFKKIPEILNNKPREIYHYPYTFINDIKDFNIKIFDKSQYLFFDIETTGLNPFKDTIKILQISNGNDIFVLDSKLLTQFDLREFFNTKKLVGQDFNFDAKFLNNYHNLDLNIFNWYWDTCLAEYTISGMMDNDLTTLCWKYCPESGGYDDEIKAIGGAHLVKDPNKLHQYGANDIGILPKIMQKQYETLHQMGKLDLFRTIMMPTNRILTKASQRGVLYDVDYLNKLDKKYEKKSFLALEGIQGIHGVRETENKFQAKFNPGSDLHKKHLLFNIHKLPVLSRTDKGNPQCTKKEMAIYAEKFNNPYCLIMEKYGSIQTLRSNFLGGALQHLHNNIGHTRYSIHSTTTGRPNSREPNLLNIARQKDIKKCFISRPNHSFVYSDEGQLEMRVASVVYKESELIKICNDTTKDFHCNITAKAFGRDYKEIYDGYKAGDEVITELRVAGKGVGFGVLYQSGAEGISKQIGRTKDESQKLIDEFFVNFPALKRNINKIKKLVIKQGFLDNYFGFRRSWPNHTEEDHGTLREAVNFMVQSVAWNFIELAMIQIDEAFISNKMESQVLLQIYDAIVVESPDDEVKDASRIVKGIMESVNQPYKGLNEVKLISDIEVGKCLGEMEKVIIT